MDKISLNKMQFFAYHGVFPEENRLGQMYTVDVDLYMDLSAAGRSDDLSATVNYAELYNNVKSIMETSTFQLIEAVAETIASQLLRIYTEIEEITVRVVKPNPPVPAFFDGVSVEIHRKRV